MLEERLGSGGYGEVWRAHRRHLDLQRALKLVRISGDDAFESWRHEISRLEELSHPHVVRFYDADLVTEGPYRDHAWIATELCERSLDDELRRRPDRVLRPEEVDLLIDQILDALSAALSRGCVHRDIKPANLLLHSSGVWKLCDFGTARLVPEGATHPVTQVIGTSPYMSAGALRGQQNHAADLYALGVTVHEALSGRLLHPRPEGLNEVEYSRLVLETPPTISPNLPRRWQTTVAALTGAYGPLDAPSLAGWFKATRGASAPAPARAAAGGELRRTAVTELAAGNGQSVARRQLFVPAPDPAAAPPAAAPSPGASSPAPERHRPVPPPPILKPSWASQALERADPTGVLRRRTVALAIDVVLTFVLCVFWYFAVIFATYDRRPDLAGQTMPCKIAEEDEGAWDCAAPGDDVYVSKGANPLMQLRWVAAPLLVFVVLQGRTGYTPGKLLRGLRVVGIDRRPPGMRRAFLRTALWVVDGVPYVVPLLGALVAARRRDKRRIGDLVAGTWVVDRKPPAPRPAPPPGGLPPPPR